MFFLFRLHVFYLVWDVVLHIKGETIDSLFVSGHSEGQPLTDGAVMLQTARAKHEDLPTFHPERFRIIKDHRSSMSLPNCQDGHAASGPTQRDSRAQSCTGKLVTDAAEHMRVHLMMPGLLTVVADE